MYYNVTLKHVSRNHCYRGKSISSTFSQSVSIALVIQLFLAHASYYIVIYGLFGSTIFFSTLPHKQHDFRKKKNCY